MDGVILFSIFFISFFIGTLLVKLIETLAKRHKARKRYLRRLETENQKLKRTVSFLVFKLETKNI